MWSEIEESSIPSEMTLNENHGGMFYTSFREAGNNFWLYSVLVKKFSSSQLRVSVVHAQ